MARAIFCFVLLHDGLLDGMCQGIFKTLLLGCAIMPIMSEVESVCITRSDDVMPLPAQFTPLLTMWGLIVSLGDSIDGEGSATSDRPVDYNAAGNAGTGPVWRGVQRYDRSQRGDGR